MVVESEGELSRSPTKYGSADNSSEEETKQPEEMQPTLMLLQNK